MGTVYCDFPEMRDIQRAVNMRSVEVLAFWAALQSRMPYWKYQPAQDPGAELSVLAQHCPCPPLQRKGVGLKTPAYTLFSSEGVERTAVEFRTNNELSFSGFFRCLSSSTLPSQQPHGPCLRALLSKADPTAHITQVYFL